MGDASGLGVLEVALLASFDAVGSHGGGPRRRCDHALRIAGVGHGVLPGIGFEVLRGLVSSSVVMVPLVDGAGNFGEYGTPPAEPSFVEARLSAVGDAALAAERGRIGVVPVGVVNGTMWAGGDRPALDPLRVCAALRAVAAGASDATVVEMVGSPRFPTGCVVHGDLEGARRGRARRVAVAAAGRGGGRRTVARVGLRSLGELRAGGACDVRGARVVWQRRGRRGRCPASPTARPSWQPVYEISHGSTVDSAELVAMIERLGSVTVTADHGSPIADVLRRWITAHGSADLDRRLIAIEDAGRAR